MNIIITKNSSLLRVCFAGGNDEWKDKHGLNIKNKNYMLINKMCRLCFKLI